MHRKFLIFSAISGFICVMLGAFGAHTLKKHISPELLSAFETGVRYQFYHTIALLVISVLILLKGENSFLKRSGYFFLAGIILFSGSLYFLSVRNLTGFELTWLGPITPLGGLCFLLGWLVLLMYAIKIKT